MLAINYRLLEEADNSKILNILDSTPMPGLVTTIYTTRPSYFNAAKYISEKNIIIGAEIENNLVGISSIYVQKRFFNNKVSNVGYLSGLRILKQYRGKNILSSGMPYLKQSLEKLNLDTCFLSIVDNNLEMLRIIKKEKINYPYFVPIGRIHTKLFWPKKKKTNLEVSVMTKKELKNMKKFVNDNSSKKDLFPYYNDIINPNLNYDNYVIAKNNNRIVGVAALWNQKSFKQIIISKYNFPFNIFVPILNKINKMNFPKQGNVLEFNYISQICIQDDNPEILKNIISFVASNLQKQTMIAIGLHENDPLLKAINDYNGIVYKSTLFLVSWYDQESLAKQLRQKLLYPEIALL